MSNVLEAAIFISSLLLGFAILCVLYKIFFKSATLEKIVALEVLANIVIGIIALWTLTQYWKYFIDITIAIALIMFLSTTAYIQALASNQEKTR